MKSFAVMTVLVLAFLIPVGVAQVFYGDGSLIFESRVRVVSVRLVDGKLHVEKREASNVCYLEGGGPSDSVWKEIYCASNGAVVLERKVKGMLVPQQTTPERVDWPDEESRKVEPSRWSTLELTNCIASNYIICTMTGITYVASITNGLLPPLPLHMAGMTFSYGTDDVLRVELDEGQKMDKAASNLVVEVKKLIKVGK